MIRASETFPCDFFLLTQKSSEWLTWPVTQLNATID